MCNEKNVEELTKDKDYKMEEGNILTDNEEENVINHNIPIHPGDEGGPIMSYEKSKLIGFHIGIKNFIHKIYCSLIEFRNVIIYIFRFLFTFDYNYLIKKNY